MKILISPAKSLDLETSLPSDRFTQPSFLAQSAQLMAVLKEKKPAQLSSLMSISESLADLNWQRNQAWSLPFSMSNARPAVYAFKGEVYLGLDAYTLPESKWEAMQDKVRILSGLYGVLRPFDLMQPYRLEMGTRLEVGVHKNLYQFWDASLTEALNAEMASEDVLLNLASAEYFKALKKNRLLANVITPHFKDYKNGQLKMISFYAKKARGMMVRYILDHDIQDATALKGFDYGGYAYSASLSSETDLVFIR